MTRFLIIGLVLLAAGCSQPELSDVDGNGIRLATLHEKPLIVNYWATWCAPCIKEIPELNHLASSQKDNLTLVGINFDQPTGKEAVSQVQRMKIEFPVLAGNPAVLLGVETPAVLPTTYIFKSGGELHATLVGPQTEQTILDAMPTE